MNMDVVRVRGGLKRVRKALARNHLSLGFIGGSITAGHPSVGGACSNWPEFIRGWFAEAYPNVRLSVYNAAIGGTGSLSGVMRADKELIEPGCDLVFIEYAVNDDGGESCFRSREGLIRRLLEEQRDIVLVYTYQVGMFSDMSAGIVPASIEVLEKLAEHYHLPSVWMGLHAFHAIRAGRLAWEAFLPKSGGRLHPEYMGSGLYAEPVIQFLKDELAMENTADIPFGAGLPVPLNANHFQHIHDIPMETWALKGPWTVSRELVFPWYSRVLSTSSENTELSFQFNGRMIAVHMNFGQCSAILRFCIDGGEWRDMSGPLGEWWVPDRDWCTAFMLADDLGPGNHTFKMRPVYGGKGAECNIFCFMAVE